MGSIELAIYENEYDCYQNTVKKIPTLAILSAVVSGVIMRMYSLK